MNIQCDTTKLEAGLRKVDERDQAWAKELCEAHGQALNDEERARLVAYLRAGRVVDDA